MKEKEARLAKEELERFEKSQDGGKKRRRQRNRHSETNTQMTFMERHKVKIVVAAVLAVVAGVGYAMLAT